MRYGADVGSSYHQYFLRGKPFLCMTISRTKVKGVGKRCSRKATDRKGKEPNFYEMKYLPQLDPWHGVAQSLPLKSFPLAKRQSKRVSMRCILLGALPNAKALQLLIFLRP